MRKPLVHPPQKATCDWMWCRWPHVPHNSDKGHTQWPALKSRALYRCHIRVNAIQRQFRPLSPLFFIVVGGDGGVTRVRKREWRNPRGSRQLPSCQPTSSNQRRQRRPPVAPGRLSPSGRRSPVSTTVGFTSVVPGVTSDIFAVSKKKQISHGCKCIGSYTLHRFVAEFRLHCVMFAEHGGLCEFTRNVFECVVCCPRRPPT